VVNLEAKISIQGISKRFEKEYVLDSISMDVFPGEFRVILGQSGTGKTTLLNIISGLIAPDKGKIILDARDITNVPTEKRNIAYIFQDLGLFSSLTVRDNIAYGLVVRKYKEDVIKRKINEYSVKFGLQNLLDKYPIELSGGQKQLVALARALIIDPSIILMDEPLSSLDTFLRNSMRWYIKNLAKSMNLTVIYVTHDVEDCAILADKVSVLSNGKIVEEGEKEEILDNPKKEETAKLLGYNIINFQGSKLFIHPYKIKIGGNIQAKIISEEKGIMFHYLLKTEFGEIYAIFDRKYDEKYGITINGV